MTDSKQKVVAQVAAENTTQVQHPWRASLRTAFAVVVALALLAKPVLDAVSASGDGSDLGGWAVAVLGVAAAITRVMALPAVEAFLVRFVPWLAADPSIKE